MANNINWYPGHMKKTRELIEANLKLVDLVIELLDARIPHSSRNPIISELTKHKKRIIVLNKSDLADENRTMAWIKHFEREGSRAIPIDSMRGKGISKLYTVLDAFQRERDETKRNMRALRIMIVGVPNVGKSSLINRLTGHKSAKTGNKPGVTRGKQWITIKNGMQLLDTPGILWPKFEDPDVGLNLAFCGNIRDEVLDIQDLGYELVGILAKEYPDKLSERYRLERIFTEKLDNMEAIAMKRGFILPGKRIDYERTGRTVVDEYREGIIGRITLENAPEN